MSILEDFLKDSNTAHTQEEVYQAFAKAVQRLGFDAHSYVLLNPNQARNQPLHKIAFYNISEEIMDVYFGQDLEKINFVHNATRLSGQQSDWYDPSLIDNKIFKDFLSELYTAGYRSGFTTPIYGLGSETALVNVGNYHSKADKNSEEAQILRMMSYHLHDRLKTLSNTQIDIIPLSPREQEVLQWIMAGKSDSVIGDIMGISSHTVDTYLRRCYKKLDVSNRVAAVVKALSLGLLGL